MVRSSIGLLIFRTSAVNPRTTTEFIPKDVAIKMNLLFTEYLMSRLVCLVLVLFPHRTNVLDIC